MANNCSTSDMAISIIFCCSSMILFILGIWGLIIFIKSYDHKLSKILFILVIILSILSLPTLVIQAILLPNECLFNLNENRIYVIDSIYVLFYGFQLDLLCAILLYRMYILFEITVAKISKPMMYIFGTIFIIYPIFTVWSGLIYAGHQHLTKICVYFIPAMGITFLEMVLFGTKLKQLLLINDKSKNNIIILTNIGTRITGLIFISLILTALHFISTLMLSGDNPSKIVLWIDGYTTIIDIFGNYLCVLLAFKSHKKLYYNLCILTDIFCKNWWYLFITTFYFKRNQNIRMLALSNIKSASQAPTQSSKDGELTNGTESTKSSEPTKSSTMTAKTDDTNNTDTHIYIE